MAELSHIESFFYERNLAKISSNFLVGAKIGDIPKDEIDSAVSKLVSQRHVLRLNVVEGKRVQLDLPPVIQYRDGEIMPVIDDIHELHFTMGEQIWALFIVGEWVLFACDHTFFDGTTAALVIEDFIKLLNGEELSEDLDVFSQYEKVTLPSWSLFLKVIGSVLVSNLKSFSLKDLFAEKVKKEVPVFETYKLQSHLFELVTADFLKIREFTKKEGLTFTEFLICLEYIALRSFHDPIQFVIPISARAVIRAPRAYGLLIAGVDQSVSATSWSSLKEQAKISESSKSNALQMVGMFKYTDVKEFVQERSQLGQRLNMVELSNLGKRESIKGKYTPAQYIFSQGLNITSQIITNSVVSSDEVTTIVTTAPLGAKLFPGFIEKVQELLQGVVNGDGLTL